MANVWTDIVLENAAQGVAITETKTAFSSTWLSEHKKLLDTLYSAVNSTSLIPGEVEKLTVLLDEAKKEGNKTKIEAREFQIDYVVKHLTRATRLAQQRLD